MAKANSPKVKRSGKRKVDVTPTYLPGFDRMIKAKGLENGSVILLSGGPGSGKSLFALNTAYNNAKKGKRVAYFSTVEEASIIKKRALSGFGWDLEALERQGLLSIKRIEPRDMVRSIEGRMREKGIEQVIESLEKVKMEASEITMPFHPDMVIIDPISAIYGELDDATKYTSYLTVLFDSLRAYNSVNIMVGEACSEGGSSKDAVEGYLVDGIIVFHNRLKGSARAREIEILKLRYSSHDTRLKRFKIGPKGIKIGT